MNLTLTIQDTTGTGKVTNSVDVSFEHELVTVKEIIEARVLKEVSEYNTRIPEYFMGLVQPTDAEKTLNGYRLKDRKKIDPEKQVYVALHAFMQNGYFILVNNKQAETLEQEVIITPATTVRFVKLTPLVGG